MHVFEDDVQSLLVRLDYDFLHDGDRQLPHQFLLVDEKQVLFLVLKEREVQLDSFSLLHEGRVFAQLVDLSDFGLYLLIVVGALEREEVDDQTEPKYEKDVACGHETNYPNSLEFILRQHVARADASPDVKNEVVHAQVLLSLSRIVEFLHVEPSVFLAVLYNLIQVEPPASHKVSNDEPDCKGFDQDNEVACFRQLYCEFFDQIQASEDGHNSSHTEYSDHNLLRQTQRTKFIKVKNAKN